VSNFSAYVSTEATAQSAATTTGASGVSALAFDPSREGSVLAVAVVEGERSCCFLLNDAMTLDS